ncbi:MAG TPA: tetratricopeptide repeat protein [Thermoanaerobaculia bacterium]|nr:tetratricopeptide repeat protein [Thermoanaerobaculia bacterium]
MRASRLLALVCLAGCASTGQPALPGRAVLEQELLARGLEDEQVIVPFAVDAEAVAWLRANVPEQGSAQARLNLLLQRLTVAEDGLGVAYDRNTTGTAAEVFRERSANCLGFMNLFVGLAREMGVPAFFLAIEDKPIYDKTGDLVVIAEHVAAGFGEGEGMLLLDFTAGEGRTYGSVRRLTDLEAIARYYSNRGVEVLQAAQPARAVEWLEMAVRLDPAQAAAWVNLGVARRRTADLAGAEAAYETALEKDPRNVSAYQNFAALLKLRGETKRAEELLALVAKLGSDNPFAYLSLGDWSLASGRRDEARRFYRQALLIDRKRPEPLAALGELELARGKLAAAQRWLKRAQKVGPDNERVKRLGEAIARTRSRA